MVGILYVTDHDKFHFKGEKGAYSSMKKAAERLINSYPDKFDTEWKAYQFLDEIKKAAAVSSHELKQQKIEAISINWNSLYERLSPQLPIIFAITDNADKLVFTVNGNKEVRKISFRTKDEAVNALQKDEKIWKALKAFYLNAEELIGHHHKLSWADFIKRITHDYLLLDETKQIDPNEIKRVSWDSEGYAYKKFDVSKVAEGPTPTWDEFTSRLDYPEVFMAWVWSIIEPDNNIRQAMWLVGKGDDGKSVVQKAITSLLGASYVKSMQARELGEKFFLSSVYGKVLVNYADCDDIYLFGNPKIKQITGGDSTSIEFKSKDSFTGDVYAKLFVTSNKNPKINPESRAQVTRLIRLEVQRPEKQDAAFQARLESEIWQFLWKCKECYFKSVNEGHNKLNLPPELQEKIFSMCASESYNLMRDFMHNMLEFGKDFYCPVSSFKLNLREFAAAQHIESSQLKYLQADVEEKLHLDGVKVSRIEHQGQMTTCFVGFRIRGEKEFKLAD